ncbi:MULTISPECIES: DUF4114 domain-containing protein [unclassified Leeuwenhoekiella]|uniref:DUF4114 domain-containing protein n=1 Tax=unclassified Leeuwenhoekiella TaxID=2615029 RepID=UPI000C667E20|nr:MULTISPECIES: DUF4114 domain-containing protein [unclassified Leeuwenhoekiella]MAW94689.1 hypothetical protein [Leeuwenhoekiella sp.]MBA82112.1 hypothetical protein [Leeuwenhoekiella sp.]
MRLKLLFFICIIPGFLLAQNFQYLGQYDSEGTPLYLEKPNDEISTSTLELISNSLPESFPVPTYNPHYISSGYDTDILVYEDADVYVTFVAEGAGYKNVLGFYTYDLENPKDRAPYDHEITIVFPNVSAKGSGGGLIAGNKVKLGRFKAGTGIGWVLLANGWKSQVTWGQWQLFSNPDFNPESETDLRFHNVLLNDPENERILLGFEDIRRDYASCDNDFNDALFCVTANPYTALSTKNYADVSSAAAVKSAYDGGLESNGDLAALIAQRNLQRVKDGVKGNQKKSQKRFSGKKFTKGGQTKLASYFPETGMFGTESSYVSTPSDLLNITNASALLAVDYYEVNDRVAAGLLIETKDHVYDHTKTICDRLNGAVLEDVRTFRLEGHEFILVKILKPDGIREYAVSFSVSQSENTQSLYSFWNIDQYPAGDYLNFQIWGTSVGQVSTLINHALAQLELNGYLQKTESAIQLPGVFVKSGYYLNGNLHLNILNKTGSREILVTVQYRETESTEISELVEQLSLNGKSDQEVEIATGYLFDAGISITDLQTGFYDALYLADGPWGVDYQEENVRLASFEIFPNDMNQMETDAVYAVERGIALNAEVKGTLNIFRHLLAGELTLDVSDLSAIAFNLESNEQVEVILVPAALENWEDRLRYALQPIDGKSAYSIPFEAFKDGTGNSAAVTAIRSVVFSIQGDYSDFKEVTLNVSGLVFNNANTLSVDELVAAEEQATAVNYPNPFTTYTIIKIPETTTSVSLRVFDMLGRLVVSTTQNTDQGCLLRLDRADLAAGAYIYKLTTDSGKEFDGKLLIN